MTHDMHAEGLHRLRGHALWFLVLGGVLVVIGMAAVAAPWVFTLTTVVVFGWMLLFSGIFGVAGAVLSAGWRGFTLYLILGLLDLIVGFLLVTRPVQGAAIVTLLLALMFLGGGLARIVSAIMLRFPHWVWAAIGGAVSVLLGLMIWAEWPSSTLWVIGTFVGIDLIFRGWAWVMFGLTLRRIPAAEVH